MAILSLPAKRTTVGVGTKRLFQSQLSTVTIVDTRSCVSLLECVVAYLDNHELCCNKGDGAVSLCVLSRMEGSYDV